MAAALQQGYYRTDSPANAGPKNCSGILKRPAHLPCARGICLDLAYLELADTVQIFICMIFLDFFKIIDQA